MKWFLSCVVTLGRRTTFPSKRSYVRKSSVFGYNLHTLIIRCAPSTEMKPLFGSAAAYSSCTVYGLSLSGGRLQLGMNTGYTPMPSEVFTAIAAIVQRSHTEQEKKKAKKTHTSSTANEDKIGWKERHNRYRNNTQCLG